MNSFSHTIDIRRFQDLLETLVNDNAPPAAQKPLDAEEDKAKPALQAAEPAKE